MSYLDSNIPSRKFYASTGFETYVRTIADLIKMVKRINLLLIPMEGQGNECICIISLFKKIFGKHFKVFHKFVDTVDKFINLFPVTDLFP